MSEEHRVKIQNSNILNALLEHVTGDRDMSSTQVSAGIALLKKTLPDLSSVEVSGDQDNPVHVVSKIERVIVDPKPATSDSESIQAAS